MLTIGIDVGITGALATLDERGQLCYLADLPISINGKMKWINGAEFLRLLFKARNVSRPARVIVEHVHAMPQLPGRESFGGVISAHSTGLTLGSILSIIQVAELPLQLVTPMKWKRALGLVMPKTTSTERKTASLEKARALFPKAALSRFKDHGRAEAILIAHWAMQASAQAAAVA